MSTDPVAIVLDQLDQAVTQLEQALTLREPNALEVDGTIQRFEFCFELSWKGLRRVLAWEGIEVRSPRSAIKAGYAQELLLDEGAWLSMLADRNLTTHVYDEATARAIHARIRSHADAMRDAWRRMSERAPG